MAGRMQSSMRVRLGFVYVLFVLFFCFIGFRLVQLQILENEDLTRMAKKQFERTRKEKTRRLSILDRNGEELAVSISAGSVFARPKLVQNKRGTARRLSKILGGSVSKWYRRLRVKRAFVWIRRQVDKKKAMRIKKARIKGIFVVPEKKRFYPNGLLASNLIGFTDIDGKGLAGVELMLDRELHLEQSKFKFSRDGKGNPSYIEKKHVQRTLQDLEGIYLTVDRRLQYILEEELDNALQETKAQSVMAVVMDPFTGEILALGQRPTFNPNQVGRYPAKLYANKVLSHLYEPGSTLKVLFASMALEWGLAKTSTPIDCGNGSIQVGRTRIGEAGSGHKYDTLPLEKVIQYSSNVGAVRIAQMLGPERVRATLRRFGLGKKTGIGLPGEATSPLRKKGEWTPLLLANVGFGQGIAITPLQLVAAFAPFANGGYLVQPQVLLREVDFSSQRKKRVRRVLSPKTADLMRRTLLSVTEDKGGTGRAARIPGVQVAGKTGTAQKYEPGKGYDGGKYFSSFIGFLPANQPQLLVGVMVDEPGDQYYASQVAAPLFQKIAKKSLHILDRVPRQMVLIKRHVGKKSVPPTPKRIVLKEKGKGIFVMPNLKGLSIREAIRGIGKSFENVRTSGFGFVTSQTPKPGNPVSSQTPISLQLAPTS